MKNENKIKNNKIIHHIIDHYNKEKRDVIKRYNDTDSNYYLLTSIDRFKEKKEDVDQIYLLTKHYEDASNRENHTSNLMRDTKTGKVYSILPSNEYLLEKDNFIVLKPIKLESYNQYIEMKEHYINYTYNYNISYIRKENGKHIQYNISIPESYKSELIEEYESIENNNSFEDILYSGDKDLIDSLMEYGNIKSITIPNKEYLDNELSKASYVRFSNLIKNTILEIDNIPDIINNNFSNISFKINYKNINKIFKEEFFENDKIKNKIKYTSLSQNEKNTIFNNSFFKNNYGIITDKDWVPLYIEYLIYGSNDIKQHNFKDIEEILEEYIEDPYFFKKTHYPQFIKLDNIYFQTLEKNKIEKHISNSMDLSIELDMFIKEENYNIAKKIHNYDYDDINKDSIIIDIIKSYIFENYDEDSAKHEIVNNHMIFPEELVYMKFNIMEDNGYVERTVKIDINAGEYYIIKDDREYQISADMIINLLSEKGYSLTNYTSSSYLLYRLNILNSNKFTDISNDYYNRSMEMFGNKMNSFMDDFISKVHDVMLEEHINEMKEQKNKEHIIIEDNNSSHEEYDENGYIIMKEEDKDMFDIDLGL